MGDFDERSGAPPARPSRHLAAIMFTDLVGYSAMAHKDEALAIRLLQKHREWVRETLPRFGGREVETIGDAFLVEFSGALSAVECAVTLQRRFEAYNEGAPYDRRMRLRIGIHLGDVEHAGDKVMGDGVNIASRIHGMAQPGGICVSEDVQRAVRNRGELRFTSLGTPKLKNIGTPLELFEVHAGRGAGRSALVSKVKRRIFGIPRWLAITIAVIVAINVFDGSGDDEDKPARKVKRDDAPPSVAVLPFENLSADPNSGFFTDGLHDTVIGHLSRVRGLKVISRTSVMGYRGKQKNLKRIGRELGADHILEGSVQRDGNRLRVVAQLIDSETDSHVWSSEYNRELKDVFAVQADIAQNVANAVHARLTPQEQAGIADVPKTSTEAYDLYLRAVAVQRKVGVSGEETLQAIGWIEQAVAIDPNYAPAYALLAHLHDDLYWGGYDPTDERRQQVGKAADAALRLDPASAEAHVAKALYHYHGSRNYEAALAELEIARRLAPSSAEVNFWIAPIYRRQSRWDEALASFDRATALDPRNVQYLSEYGGTLQMMRLYDAAEEVFDRAMKLDPDNAFLKVGMGYHHLFATGDMTELEEAVAAIPPGVDPGCQVTGMRVGLAILQRRLGEAMAAGSQCKEKFLAASGGVKVPIELFAAQLKWLAAGRKPVPEADRALEIMQRMVSEDPENAVLRMNLAFALTMVGRRAEAVKEADRAVAALPMSRDAVTGAELRRNAVDVYANAGEEERAIDELEDLMRRPNGGHARQLELDPGMDPLRSNPRFQKLLDTYLQKTA